MMFCVTSLFQMLMTLEPSALCERQMPKGRRRLYPNLCDDRLAKLPIEKSARRLTHADFGAKTPCIRLRPYADNNRPRLTFRKTIPQF